MRPVFSSIHTDMAQHKKKTFLRQFFIIVGFIDIANVGSAGNVNVLIGNVPDFRLHALQSVPSYVKSCFFYKNIEYQAKRFHIKTKLHFMI